MKLCDTSVTEIIQILIALGALSVAIATIIHTKIITKKSKTADLLMNLDNNKELIQSLIVIRDIKFSEKTAEIYAEDEYKDSIETKSIRYVLNHFERVAACIENGVYDFSLIKSTQSNRFIKTFNVTKPYIIRIRENTASPEAYVAIEALVKKLER